MDTLTTGELVSLTKATFRQIDYWSTTHLIPTLGDSSPGSGGRRSFDKSIVPRVKLLVTISKALNNPRFELLQKIYENYDEGYVFFENGIVLSWAKTMFEVGEIKL